MASASRLPMPPGPLFLCMGELMTDGWIKLYRKSIESQVFKNPYLWQLWTWCLMKANHQQCWVNVRTGRGETQVKLDPGQFIFGRHSAAKELGWPPSTVRNRLTLLGNMQNLDTQKEQHYSIVTIRNWEIYQISEKDREQAKRTTKGQPKDTDKNNKNKEYMLKCFERFWNEYPKKVGKKKAREEFLKLSLDEERFKKIMEALKTQKESPQWKRNRGQYVPHPTTWLHGERWEDEVESSGDDEPMLDYIGEPLKKVN
ncbi:MAG: hypothetical protein ACFFCW_37725 [Candidatus Hodarchaeota archaeon]